MPDYSDPLDAAVRRPQFSGGAYDQTDVWHDRGWLMANVGRRDAIGRQAQFALRDLDRQEALAQRSQALAIRHDEVQQGLALRHAALDQGIGLRAAALAQHGAAMDQHALEFEANQRRLMAHDAATQSAHQLTTDRNTEIDEQGAGLLGSMLKLDGALRNGHITKDQYDQGLLEAGQQFPLGFRHPEAAKHYNFAVEEADKQNDFRARQEFRTASQLGAKYGIGVQPDPETGLPSVEHTRLAALATPKGQNEALHNLDTQIRGRYGLSAASVFEHAAGGRMDNPADPKTFKQTDPNDQQNPQTHVRMQVISPQGTQHDVIMEKPHFDAIKNEFTPAYQQILAARPLPSQPAAGATPTGAQPGSPAATVRMRSPDGSESDVPADHAAHYQSLGATPVTQ